AAPARHSVQRQHLGASRGPWDGNRHDPPLAVARSWQDEGTAGAAERAGHRHAFRYGAPEQGSERQPVAGNRLLDSPGDPAAAASDSFRLAKIWAEIR